MRRIEVHEKLKYTIFSHNFKSEQKPKQFLIIQTDPVVIHLQVCGLVRSRSLDYQSQQQLHTNTMDSSYLSAIALNNASWGHNRIHFKKRIYLKFCTQRYNNNINCWNWGHQRTTFNANLSGYISFQLSPLLIENSVCWLIPNWLAIILYLVFLFGSLTIFLISLTFAGVSLALGLKSGL